jgi:glycosyltransferase involved in cell wall biosynthesis
VFNWIDHEQFRPLADRAAQRARYGIGPDQTAFYFGGRFDYTKHVDRVIDALRGLDEPRAVFFFAGDGVLGDELRALSRDNPNVRVLGTVPRAELPALHVVMEAMSSGLPVHTSNKTMNPLYEGWDVEPDFLDVPRCARLYPPDRTGIRRAIREAIENRDALNASRPAVAAFARQRFGSANAAALVDLLRSLAERSRGTAAAGELIRSVPPGETNAKRVSG